MLAGAAATSGLLGVAQGFWAAHKDSAHQRVWTVLWTAVPSAWEMLVSQVWWRPARHSVVVIWCHTEPSLPPPFHFLQLSLSSLSLTELCGILQLTEGCPECTGHSRAQSTTKPLLDTHGLVKAQTVMKDSQGKMRQPSENYSKGRTCTGIKLQVHIPGWNFSCELAEKVFQAELLEDSVLSSLVADYRKSGSVNDCTPYAMQNLLMSKYQHTDISLSFASSSFKFCPDIQKLFEQEKVLL